MLAIATYDEDRLSIQAQISALETLAVALKPPVERLKLAEQTWQATQVRVDRNLDHLRRAKESMQKALDRQAEAELHLAAMRQLVALGSPSSPASSLPVSGSAEFQPFVQLLSFIKGRAASSGSLPQVQTADLEVLNQLIGGIAWQPLPQTSQQSPAQLPTQVGSAEQQAHFEEPPAQQPAHGGVIEDSEDECMEDRHLDAQLQELRAQQALADAAPRTPARRSTVSASTPLSSLTPGVAPSQLSPRAGAKALLNDADGLLQAAFSKNKQYAKSGMRFDPYQAFSPGSMAPASPARAQEAPGPF